MPDVLLLLLLLLLLFILLLLDLLDYVSRAHEIEICPSSVRRPFVSQSSLNLIHGFFFYQILVVASLGHTLGLFFLIFFF